MTKTLTQDDFKDAPDWVKSAAVDADGWAWLHSVTKNELILEPEYFWNYKNSLSKFIGMGYDTTNWQNSAIDKE